MPWGCRRVFFRRANAPDTPNVQRSVSEKETQTFIMQRSPRPGHLLSKRTESHSGSLPQTESTGGPSGGRGTKRHAFCSKASTRYSYRKTE